MATIDLDSFFLAARLGYIPILKQGLSEGIDIHTNDDLAIRLAIISGKQDAIEFLLKNGANEQIFDNSLLRFASLYGETDVVKNLLHKGSCDQETKIHAINNAILHGYPSIVKLLLENGVSPTDNNNAILKVVKFCKYDEIIVLFKDYFN